MVQRSSRSGQGAGARDCSMSEDAGIYQVTEEAPSHFVPLPRNRLPRFFRNHIAAHILGERVAPPEGFAIYSLSDPRDIRSIRYIGQTRAPRRRWSQHVNTSRLWMPDEIPWWVQSARLRPLYHWIRELHREDYRLPFMVVTEWVETVAEARARERTLILEALEQRMPLLNVEATSRR
jgi:hypothetical protein